MNEPRTHKALTAMSRRDLARWGKEYAKRDELVRQAALSGVGVNETVRLTGLAKTTVLRILRDAPVRRSAAQRELDELDVARTAATYSDGRP